MHSPSMLSPFKASRAESKDLARLGSVYASYAFTYAVLLQK